MSARRRSIEGSLALALLAVFASHSLATGLLVPTDKSVGPLGIVYQRINVEIRDQAAVTRVEQEFRNHTSQPLEAYYLFPLPPGAGVKDFVMWIGGQRVTAEMVEAAKARKIYEDIVRRMKDPGLLEHMGNDLWRVRVFPVPPRSTQKIEISYSQLVRSDAGVAEYVYPLKTGNQAVRTEQDFTVRLELHSSTALKSIYSPSHEVSTERKGDHHATVGFEGNKYPLNRDFRLYWTLSEKEVGLSLLTHRESPGEPGYFLMLVSPRTKASEQNRVPRDVVFVLDTSGSMKGEKIEQAKNALKYCLKSLDKADRFGLIGFATTVNELDTELRKVNKDSIRQAIAWVEDLNASGGTAISEALEATLKMRGNSERSFTVVFLTDGQPTIGETEPSKILTQVKEQNQDGTRIFCFGVGDDVNTHLLDQLSEQSRATTVYVRPSENLEVKVSSFYAKISYPVLANLKLSVGDSDLRLLEMYPPKLPDLFHGGQLTVLGRYKGTGHSSIRLAGDLGQEHREFVYEIALPNEKHDNEFLPGLWARRKVGYLLDQIRLKGENQELVDEVVRLAKHYGIVTPYTSYLIVPDEKPRLAANEPSRSPEGRPLDRKRRFTLPWEMQMGPRSAESSAPAQPSSERLDDALTANLRAEAPAGTTQALAQGRGAGGASVAGRMLSLQTGQSAVDVAEKLAELKKAKASAAQAVRIVGKKSFVNVNDVWIDQDYRKGATIVRIKYLSEAYFRILELFPEAKTVLALGSRVVWITPSGQALAVDETGKETLADEKIRALFVAPGS